MAALYLFGGKRIRFSFVQTFGGAPAEVVNFVTLAEKFLDDPGSYSIDELAACTLTVCKLAYYQRGIKRQGGCRLMAGGRRDFSHVEWYYAFSRPNYRLNIEACEVLHEGHQWTPLRFYLGTFPDFRTNLDKIMATQLSAEAIERARQQR
jgi:hypothetical protein